MYGNDNPPEDLYFAPGSDDEFQEDEIPEFEIPEDEDSCDFEDDMTGEDYDWE